MKLIRILLLAVPILILPVMGFKSCNPKGTHFECSNGIKDVTIVSDLDLSKKQLLGVCKDYVFALNVFMESKKITNNSPVNIYYYSAPIYESLDGRTDRLAYSEGGDIFIKISGVVSGTPDIRNQSAYSEENLTIILLHELYHVWSFDQNQENACVFADKVWKRF